MLRTTAEKKHHGLVIFIKQYGYSGLMNKFIKYFEDTSILSLMVGLLVCVLVLILLVILHFWLYGWVYSSFIGYDERNPLKPMWRTAFAAIMLVILYGTIGLAGLMAYRKRK